MTAKNEIPIMPQPHLSAHDQLTDRDLLILASDWCEAGRQVVLAFVMRTWGSAPRQTGALLVMDSQMEIAGSVSGGCIEGAIPPVIEAGLASLESGVWYPSLHFGVADKTAWSVGLSCGGEIDILLTPIAEQGLPVSVLQEMAAICQTRQPVEIPFNAQTGKAGALVSALDTHDMRSVLSEDGQIFTLRYAAPPHLILIGAVHISQYLAQMATSCGFGVSIIDPRGIFATDQRFAPSVRLLTGWPSDYLADISLDSTTALVTLTHDPKIDEDALVPALSSDIFYLASLGSTRTHASRIKRLAEKGMGADQIARISGPAGLDIGAKSPAEIAVSILAELIAAWRAQAGQAKGRQRTR